MSDQIRQSRTDQGRFDSDLPFMNEKIPYRSLQVIAADGKNMGVMTKEDALRMAREAVLDLVIIAEKAGETPIAKIVDYGKMSYSKKKQQVAARKKQRTIQVKEIQISPKIGDHDFMTKMHKVGEFLQDAKHVKIVLVFRGGRELATREQRGTELLARIDAYLDTHFAQGTLVREKDAKLGSNWSRVYYCK